MVFGAVVGLLVAWLAYQWITDSTRQEQRAEQERVVHAARNILVARLALDEPELVDPLEPQRKVGKVYIYPVEDGWEVSGFYRRNEDDRWHAWLMLLDPALGLQLLKVQDPAVAGRAEMDALVEISR